MGFPDAEQNFFLVSEDSEPIKVGVMNSKAGRLSVTGKTYYENFNANIKNQLTRFGYDAAGNMTSGSGCSSTCTYDAESRLTSAAGVTHTYDGDGKRVKKSPGKLYWAGGPGSSLK